MAWPIYYEEAIDNLNEAITLKDFSHKENTFRLTKSHEKLLLLKMIDLYSQDITNKKPGFLLPIDDVRVKEISSDIQKISKKKFWCSVFTKALNQLAASKQSHIKEGYEVIACSVYIFWQRPPSMYPDPFTKNPKQILKLTSDLRDKQ